MPSQVSAARYPQRSQTTGPGTSRRPSTIAELAERAMNHLWDPSKELKSYLKAAEQYRKTGKAYAEAGDLENAFVEYARAATIVLEKLPTHRDYYTLLNATQRHNLSLNGQDILDSLSALKPTLVDRHERWLCQHPEDVTDETHVSYSSHSRQPSDGTETTRRIAESPSPNFNSRSPYRSNTYDTHVQIPSTSNNIYSRSPNTVAYSDPRTPAAIYNSTTPGRPPNSTPAYTRAPSSNPQSQGHSPAYPLDPSPRRDNTDPSPRYKTPDPSPGRSAYEDPSPRRSTYEKYASSEHYRQDEGRELPSQRGEDFRRADSRRRREHRSRGRDSDGDHEPRPSGLQEETSATARQAGGYAPYESSREPPEAEQSGLIRTQDSFVNETARRQQEDTTRQEQSERRHQWEEVQKPQAETANQKEGPQRRRDEENRRQQDEMRRREEDIRRRHNDDRRRQEQEGIMRRQHEAENAARQARQDQIYLPPPLPIYSSDHVVVPNPITASTVMTSSQPSVVPSIPTLIPPPPPPQLRQEEGSYRSVSETPVAQPLPLVSPLQDDDTTDSEAPNDPQGTVRAKRQDDGHFNRSLRALKYPPPITTTSPAPPEVTHIEYPALMSQHQMTQGYVPSLQSMFRPHMRSSPDRATLLFVPESAQPNATGIYYPSNALPPRSIQAAGTSSTSRYDGMPGQQYPIQYPHQVRGSDGLPPSFNYPQLGRPAPPPAQPQRGPLPRPAPESRIISPADAPTTAVKELKTVNLPRECLSRFLSIAALNTARNRETCGLLLGKDKGHKFVVTTLLIPKQHSTSDTCTMDEEELVLEFTEERSLITLGWIHTHPSQSCFMSSVDLHTHSGFQRMLPESFAVVCAPKHKPNFGIFRLTDPPGLQAILECNAKEAFHPHPDVPIYTDADKGHVQMKDISLEIVDLR